MKKFIVFALIAILSTSLFAAAYRITDVTGRVFLGSSQEEVEVGQILEEDTILNIRPGSSITITPVEKTEKRTFKKPANRISVRDIWVESYIGKTKLNKVKIASAVAEDTATGTRKAVVTAASRASEAKEDFEWDE